MADDKPQRIIPANDLDLQMQITDPAWQNLNPELQAKLVKFVGVVIKDKVETDVYEKLASVLSIYTRDVRLGNLNSANGEVEFVSYYFELAVDLLLSGYPEACIVALNRALSVLEPSNSRGGFLRKLINTIRQESFSTTSEPKKQNLVGGKGGN